VNKIRNIRMKIVPTKEETKQTRKDNHKGIRPKEKTKGNKIRTTAEKQKNKL